MKYVIIGGVAGGATTAARLRRLDEHCEIVMFEKGEHISYANCGLPYYIGDKITEKKALLLQPPSVSAIATMWMFVCVRRLLLSIQNAKR